jgi:hypothetical protein
MAKRQKYFLYKVVRASVSREIMKSIIFAHIHQDERLLVFFFASNLVPNIALFIHIKYTILMIVIYYKRQMVHPITFKSCRIAYFNFSSR